MRLTVAIEKFLEYGQAQRDWSEETLRSYGDLLYKLADRHPHAGLHEFEGREGRERLLGFVATWATLSAGSRRTRISILHSFFDWCEIEDLIESNAARKIRRPPARRIHRQRPDAAEMLLIRRAARCETDDPERPAILAMEGLGLRRSEVIASRWRDWDLRRGRLRLVRKGGKLVEIPIPADVLEEMRDCYRALAPEADDYIFPSQTFRYEASGRSVRRVRDPKQPSSASALARMLERVCERAGVARRHPHQLRHGFATRLDREDRLDLRTIQFMLGHEHPETTQTYLDERLVEDAAERLQEAHKRRQTRQRRKPQPSSSLESQSDDPEAHNLGTPPQPVAPLENGYTDASEIAGNDEIGGHK